MSVISKFVLWTCLDNCPNVNLAKSSEFLIPQAINYPTVPRGSELLRFVATPFHTPQMMDYLITALDDVWNTLDLTRSAQY